MSRQRKGGHAPSRPRKNLRNFRGFPNGNRSSCIRNHGSQGQKNYLYGSLHGSSG